MVALASLSAFSAISASRTSLVPAPRSSCWSRSLASSGLTPTGSATCSPRTASRRASGLQGQRKRWLASTQPCSQPPFKLAPHRSQALLADHTRAEADLAVVPRGKLTGRKSLVAAMQLHVRAPHRVERHFG
eukprot:scaffold65318_cov57-Phaeocystis_antarctica.AAC.1